MIGNSYTNWNKITPRHNSFIQHILQSPAHLVGTIRAKQEYVLSEKNGKQVPEKVGMKGVTREGMDYEFTLVFELDMKNNAIATKDRTSLFFGKPEFKLTQEIGKKILNWCNEGLSAEEEKNLFKQRINDCKKLDELLRLFTENPTEDPELLQCFSNRRATIEGKPPVTSTQLNNQSKSNNYGTYRNTDIKQ
jgi:hypothetical protein